MSESAQTCAHALTVTNGVYRTRNTLGQESSYVLRGSRVARGGCKPIEVLTHLSTRQSDFEHFCLPLDCHHT